MVKNKYPAKVIETLGKGIPSQIMFHENGTEIVLMLCKKATGLGDGKNLNMQEDGAAFEGWALILKASQEYTSVVLDVDMDKLAEPLLTMGHYNRFLYRAMRFAECYSWFTLSPKVKIAVDCFRNTYYSGHCNLVNNIGNGDAGDNNNLENYLEGLLGKNPNLASQVTGISPLHRQLPVGLFTNHVAKATSLFTGGKSAIDLWGRNGESLHIFELKANNEKVGVLSELFFYACYAYDLYCEGSPKFIIPQKPSFKNDRGYRNLFNGNIEKIAAHILTNSLHSRIDENVIQLMRDTCKNKRIVFADPILYELMSMKLK